MFLGISHLFLRWTGPKSIAKIDRQGHGRIGTPWVRHCVLFGYEHVCNNCM